MILCGLSEDESDYFSGIFLWLRCPEGEVLDEGIREILLAHKTSCPQCRELERETVEQFQSAPGFDSLELSALGQFVKNVFLDAGMSAEQSMREYREQKQLSQLAGVDSPFNQVERLEELTEDYTKNLMWAMLLKTHIEATIGSSG